MKTKVDDIKANKIDPIPPEKMSEAKENFEKELKIFKKTKKICLEIINDISDGLELKLKDTFEKIGIEKSKEIANNSDLIIAIFDSSKKMSEDDLEILKLVEDKTAIIILNKIDLGEKIIEIDKIKAVNKPVVEISALNKEGIENIYNEIKNLYNINSINVGEENIVTNTRHLELIRKAKENTLKAKEVINQNMPIDIISIYIKEIIESLNTITGENATEDLINDIFSKFCLGK